MYRQIEIHSKARDYLRILWRFEPDEPITECTPGFDHLHIDGLRLLKTELVRSRAYFGDMFQPAKIQ